MIGKHFQPGKWTKICSLHFEPKDFHNVWSRVSRGELKHETSKAKSHCATSIETSGSSTGTPVTEQTDELCCCKCQGQIKQLEKEVLEARGEAAQLKKELEETKEEIAKLTTHEITKAREEITILKQELEAAKFEITTLTQRLDELN